MASSRAFCSVEAWRVRRGRKSEARPTAREDRAAEAVHEGMTDVAIGGRFLEESLQDIGDDNKEVRGNRVALMKALAALEPAPRHTIEKDGRRARSERVGNPGAPPVTETARAKDEIEAVPGNRVKSLF